MSHTPEKDGPDPEISEGYGPAANFESIIDNCKSWNSNTNSLQLNADYDQLLKRLWWPKASIFKSHSESQSTVIIERKLFAYHWLCLVKQTISIETEPLVWNDGSVGVAALEQLFDRLDVFIISARFRDIAQVKHIGSGASFDVSLSRALKDSNIPPDRAGCTRLQWLNGDWLAIKRGLFTMHLQEPMGVKSDGQTYRAVLQEVRILSCPDIRQHPNFVRLFAVAWEEHAGSGGETFVTPVLVQSYATHGNLSGFLRAKFLEGILTRQLKMQLITGIAEGLQTLHNLGVVHGDVKCENILVSWDAAGMKFVPKISDFGFSLIQNSSSFSDFTASSISTYGATRRYVAPELWTASENSPQSIPKSLATRMDIYSFALVLVTILLNGEDVFEAFMKHLVERGSIVHLSPSLALEEVTDALITRTKTDSRMEKYFFEGIKSLLSKQDLGFSSEVFSVISKMLKQDPEARLADLAIVKSLFSPPLGLDTLSGASTEGLRISGIKSNNSALTLLPQHYERFLIDGKPGNALILEARVGYSFLLDRISPAHETHLLRDWLQKTEPILGVTSLTEMSFEMRTTSAFCAHQAAVCHIYAIGVDYDPARALKLITASARAGYITSLALVRPLHEALGHQCPADIPVEHALKEMVAVGPRYGFIPWALACRQLRNTSRQAFHDALHVLQNHGYLELGEYRDDLDDSHQDQIRGDPRHCCFDFGTFSFALYCIPRFPAKVFLSGISGGLIPKDSRNHNGESILYMCCRAGDHEKVLMLLDVFEWARGEVIVATKQGRFPLHWVCMMDSAFSEQVVTALIENGADPTAIDEDGLSTFDYAISYGREDIALSLLEKAKNLFKAPSSRAFIERTLLVAIQNKHLTLARKLMQKASVDELIGALGSLGSYRQEVRYGTHGKGAAVALREIFEFAASYLEGREDIAEVWSQIILNNCRSRAADVLRAILDSKVVRELDSSMATCATLSTAAKWRDTVVFDSILALMPQIEVDHASLLFAFIIENTRGPQQFHFSQSLLEKLKADGIAHDVVNYVLPGSCSSSCAQDHPHNYDPELFTVAVRAKCFDIARSLAPYHCHKSGQQITTMYFLLHSEKKDSGLLEQLDFLMSSGPGHSDSLCNPFLGSTVLHEAVQTFVLFPSESLYRDALGILLEEYDDSIDETNKVGYTALQLAAVVKNANAVRMLLEYGANAALEARPGRAYDFAFRRLYVELCNCNLLHQGQSIIATAWTDDTSREVQSNRTVAGSIETQLDIMGLLCDGDGRPISEQIFYDTGTGEISTGKDWLGKKGLSIKLRRWKLPQMNVLIEEFTVVKERYGNRITMLLCREWVLVIELDDAWYEELAAELAARSGVILDSSSPFEFGATKLHS
ncbi:hypothetical protein BKA66DRAFT_579432 [Pyrenochaeta sp. MPI-SDFR-AT-0127]|nr:hypothetical protein BKA66DRAFT_579432 [Pyrenochaeta sp. MPI-SDFR-AT-0127]